MAAAGRMHTYLASAKVSYIRDGVPKSRRMNQVIAVEQQRITLVTLELAKTEILNRLHAEIGVPKEDVKDFVYDNISYLGHMSEREFTGQIPTRSSASATTKTYHS